MKTLPPKAEMERAYLERDASYDGVFFVAVRTFGKTPGSYRKRAVGPGF